MDMIKIGQFLSKLRKEKGLTQDQLGERLGVTNKTVSRWETGTYLPPVEVLQLLSELYGVSINEILCGERLSEENYKDKAEENLTHTLSNSAFTVKEKKTYFEKKWRKDHVVELTIEILILIVGAVLGAIFYKEVCIAMSILCLVWAWWIKNRMATYVENNVYGHTDLETTKSNDDKN